MEVREVASRSIRWVPVTAIPVGVFLVARWSSVARAHSGSSGGGPPLDLAVVITVIVGSGVIGGVLATGSSNTRSRFDPLGHLSPFIGPLLVILGFLAAASAVAQRPSIAVPGLLVGVAGAGIVAVRSDRRTCADATVGAIVVHRLLEGITLAAAYIVGSAIGIVGAIVLAVHATAECVAVGGSYGGSKRRRAVAAVLTVQFVFVIGTVIGVLATGGLPSVVRMGALGLLGGVLFVLGINEGTGAH